ncbi:MAG TPA: metallophosphoesterase [Actinomycetota bacterium]|nr:metallophosphoesterase [Actinomycetota bacterium]
MIRVAATGDLHFGQDSAGTLRPHLDGLARDADLLLIAGDLTKAGEPDEAAVLAAELRDLPVPAVAILGNHDHHADREDEVAAAVEDAGVAVLRERGTVVHVAGLRVGIAGAKGFGGGFPGASASDFGEPEMKAFVRHTKNIAVLFEAALAELEADLRIALLHYAPVRETLEGEPLEIYPFLGSSLLGEAIDRAGADLALHGHAHRGSEHGRTPGGVEVRNVALSVIDAAYRVYRLDGSMNRRLTSGAAATPG